jgi:hypothetical protein
MGEMQFTADAHHHHVQLWCLFGVSFLVDVSSPMEGTEPGDTIKLVSGNKAVTSQNTARLIHNPHVCSRYHPILYGVGGREQAAGYVDRCRCRSGHRP